MAPHLNDNMSDPIKIVKNFYAALSRGDVASVLATLGDDLEWTEAERFPYYSGTWRSPQKSTTSYSCLFHGIGKDSRRHRMISSPAVNA